MSRDTGIPINIYRDMYEEDIIELIEAIRNTEMYTRWGADVKNELLNILYYEA